MPKVDAGLPDVPLAATVQHVAAARRICVVAHRVRWWPSWLKQYGLAGHRSANVDVAGIVWVGNRVAHSWNFDEVAARRK